MLQFKSGALPVRQIGLMAGLLVLGAIILSPVVAAFILKPQPNKQQKQRGSTENTIPVIYSLCASSGLALLYKTVKG